MNDLANFDAEAGIHFGFIYSNAEGLHNESIYEEIFGGNDSTDLGYESAKSEAKANVNGLWIEFTTEDHDKASTAELVKSRCGDWMDEDDQETLVTSLMEDEYDHADEVWADVEDWWGEAMSNSCCESGPYRYESDGYIIDTTSDNGM